MARSVGWTVLKWVAIPIGLTALGYFVLGARMGRVLSNPSPRPPAASTDQPKATPPPSSQASYPAPDVDVKVGEMSQATLEERKPRRRRHRTRPTAPPATPAKAPPPAAPPVDEGGSGGAVGGLDGGE